MSSAVAAEPMAAVAARLGPDEPGPAEVDHHLGQEPRRDTHLDRDPAGADAARSPSIRARAIIARMA